MNLFSIVCVCLLSLQVTLMANEPKTNGVPLIKGVPRGDSNSRLAHEQLLQKARSGKIDIYFAGDSITRRWGTSDPQYQQLFNHWKSHFYGWNAANFGWGGDSIENILWRMENGELDGVHPKIIVLNGGINNFAHETNAAKQVDHVVGGVKALLAVFKEKAPAAIVVLTAIFPRNDKMSVMPFIRETNAKLAKLADGKRVRFLDINDRIADADGKFLEGMVTADKLHPALGTYQVWAEGLKPMFREILGPPASVDLAPPPTGDPSAQKRSVPNRIQ